MFNVRPPGPASLKSYRGDSPPASAPPSLWGYLEVVASPAVIHSPCTITVLVRRAMEPFACCYFCCFSEQILTFDERGVSGHPDHSAVHRGVMHLLRQPKPATGVGFEADAYELLSTGLLRKYSGLLDLPLSLLLSRWPPHGAFFVSFSARRAWRAMAAHRSQFVWYRRLFVIFSRFAYVNTLRRMPQSR